MIKRILSIPVKSEIDIVLRPCVVNTDLYMVRFLPPCINVPSNALALLAIFRELLIKARCELKANVINNMALFLIDNF